jgi:nucleoid-associated protein YgaU
MGLMDKIFDKDDDRDRKATPAASEAAPRKDAPRADFSDVRGTSSSTAAADSTPAKRSYTVVSGDSLSKIAKREYGDASKWHAIFDANRDTIKDPDLIHPGQVLTLPPTA